MPKGSIMKSVFRLRARNLSGERGFTMVEMMVALLVLTVGDLLDGRRLHGVVEGAGDEQRPRTRDARRERRTGVDGRDPLCPARVRVEPDQLSRHVRGLRTRWWWPLRVRRRPERPPRAVRPIRSGATSRGQRWKATPRRTSGCIVQVAWTDTVGLARRFVWMGRCIRMAAPRSSASASCEREPDGDTLPGTRRGSRRWCPRSTRPPSSTSSWTAGSPGADASGRSTIRATAEATWNVATTNQPGATTTYALTALSPGTAYDLRVRGLTGALTSSWATTTATTQSAPSTCTVTSVAVSPTTSDRKGNGHLKKTSR